MYNKQYYNKPNGVAVHDEKEHSTKGVISEEEDTFELPITNEERLAMDAYMDVPLSDKKFFELWDFMQEEPEINRGNGRDLILAFVRKHRLPKGKMIKWLDDHKIEKDRDLIPLIFKPLEEKYRRENKDDINKMIDDAFMAELDEELSRISAEERAKKQKLQEDKIQ
jgi:hypothetical protein